MRLPGTTRRKVGTTSNHHAPYDLGYTRNTMAVKRGKQSGDAEQNPKNGPSSDCRLQPAYTKLELLVIADQHAAVNTSYAQRVHTALQATCGAKTVLDDYGHHDRQSERLNAALRWVERVL